MKGELNKYIYSKIADIDLIANLFKYHRVYYCDFTGDYLSWIINRKFSKNLFFYLKGAPANKEFGVSWYPVGDQRV